MSNVTNIEWADSTFNPWIGCTNVSPACDHCYAEVATPSRTLGVEWGAGKPRHRTSAANWRQPLTWNRDDGIKLRAWEGIKEQYPALNDDQLVAAGFIKPRRRRVFCASLADVFDNAVDPAWRADLFALIEATPNLDWLLLTKRIGNVAKMAPVSWLGGPVQHGPDPNNIHGGWPAHVWLGATICNQAEADRDVPKLLRLPAAVRFLSIEPMLGPVNVRWALSRNIAELAAGFLERGSFAPGGEMLRRLDWIIAGGESGSHARPSHPGWFRSLRDQCAAARVAFMFKQWGEWAPYGRSTTDDSGHAVPFSVDDPMQRFGKKIAGRKLDGVTHDGYPDQRSKV